MGGACCPLPIRTCRRSGWGARPHPAWPPPAPAARQPAGRGPPIAGVRHALPPSLPVGRGGRGLGPRRLRPGGRLRRPRPLPAALAAGPGKAINLPNPRPVGSLLRWLAPPPLPFPNPSVIVLDLVSAGGAGAGPTLGPGGVSPTRLGCLGAGGPGGRCGGDAPDDAPDRASQEAGPPTAKTQTPHPDHALSKRGEEESSQGDEENSWCHFGKFILKEGTTMSTR